MIRNFGENDNTYSGFGIRGARIEYINCKQRHQAEPIRNLREVTLRTACIVLVLFSLLTVGGCGDDSSSQKAEIEEQRVLLDEATFGDEVGKFIKKYRIKSSTQNQAAMTMVRKERKELISSFPNEFENWAVKIDSVRTDTDGEAYIKFTIPNHPQISLNADIEPDHESYKFIANAKLGSIMKISGAFNEGDDDDYFYEQSFTEEGSLTEPEFTIELLNVSGKND